MVVELRSRVSESLREISNALSAGDLDGVRAALAAAFLVLDDVHDAAA